MPKKHKSGGKKGTTPPNRKSFKLNDSNPHFSLRDEVLNTERHHEQWTPAKRLRDHQVSFVRAGSIQPLEEAEIDEPAVTQLQSTEEDDVDEDLDHLEAEDGAMASMKIAVDTESAVDTFVAETDTIIIEDAQQEANARAQAQFEVEDMVITDALPVQEVVHEEEAMEDASASLFFVDTAGDDALAFKGPKSTPALPRPASPTPSDSSEEVVFRGRGVTVRDDPPVPEKTLAKPITGPADGPLDALARAIDAEDTQPLAEATTWGYTKPPKEEPKHWAHADGSVSHQQTVWPTSSQPRPRLDEHFSAIKPAPGKSKRARKKQNKLMRQELDPEDDFLQDYIDNMDPEDKAALLGQGDDSADDLFNKLLDEIDPDDNLNPIERGPIEVNTSSGSDAWSTDNGEDEDEDEDDQDMDFDEDEEEDDDEDMDSSELEDHLEYTERQQWEDEADLRQRQQDAMTDEELARIFAKQEELGLGGDEMLLFDDSGFGDLDAARAGLDRFDDLAGITFGSNSRNKNGMRKTKRGRKSDHFPDASLMADVLEEDPYGGFDVMDFDRPSLKVKLKGRKPAGILPEELGLSDEELISDLQSAWANDRSKKASRKAEREELRSLGLLGSGGKKKKGNKFKPDLSVRYEEGISMSQSRVEVRDFLDNEDWSTKAFPPMLKQDRKVLHEIANYFNLKSKSVGSGKNRAPVLIKTTKTIEWSEDRFHRASSKVARGFLRQPGAKSKTNALAAQVKKGRGGGAGGMGSYADGQVVGAGAQEIGASNFGRKLMEKMGWQAGMALGKEGNTGLLVPVEARIKSGKGGLG